MKQDALIFIYFLQGNPVHGDVIQIVTLNPGNNLAKSPTKQSLVEFTGILPKDSLRDRRRNIDFNGLHGCQMSFILGQQPLQ